MEFDKKSKQIGAAAVAAIAIGAALVSHESKPKPNVLDGTDDALTRRELQDEFKDLIQLQGGYQGSAAILNLTSQQLPMPSKQTSVQTDLSERFMQIIERLKHGSSGLK